MFTEPKLDNRNALPYVGIRSQVAMQELPNVIPQHLEEVVIWLQQQGASPDGAPIIRYHACPTVAEPTAKVDITVGWPVATALKGNNRITADAIPAGRYASLVYTGVENGIKGNGALVDWAASQGLQWDSWDVEKAEAFAGRVEHLLDGPDDDPNPSNWDTEVAIKLK